MFKFLAYMVTTNIKHNQCLYLYKFLYNIPFALVPLIQNTFGFHKNYKACQKEKKKKSTVCENSISTTARLRYDENIESIIYDIKNIYN